MLVFGALYYACIIFAGSIFISARICDLRIAFLAGLVFYSVFVGAAVTLSTETALWMSFSNTVTVPSIADILFNGTKAFGSRFASGVFTMLGDLVTCLGVCRRRRAIRVELQHVSDSSVEDALVGSLCNGAIFVLLLA